MTQLTYGQDQAQHIELSVLAQMYDEVDKEIERSLIAGTPDLALRFGESLLVTGHLRGVQLMKLFYELDQVWDKFETDDTIEDAVFKLTGASSRKFEEYKEIYEHIIRDHPKMAGKPIGGLLDIRVAAREGDFDEDHWRRLEKAPDRSTMQSIRRDVRGIQTSGYGRLVITLARDGQLHCRRGDSAKKHIGYLTRDDSEPDVAAAVARIIDSAGVMKL